MPLALQGDQRLQSSSSQLDPSSDASAFQPFVSSQKDVPELTAKSIFFGLLFVILFGAASVYLALCSGWPVGGSIPVSVIAIGMLKRFGKSTVLENNMVQTIGSAGESIASGAVFTVPAFLFLQGGDQYFQPVQVIVLAAVGGLLGMLFMIPLRRNLIVKEHKTLRYPEGTACAEVLIAGEREGNLAKPVFVGSLMAAVYWAAMKLLGFWKELPYLLHQKAQDFYPNATFSVNVTPEYMGIGYIIGPRVTLQILAGSIFAWLVLVPLFSAFPQILLWLHAPDVHTTLRELGIRIGSEVGPPNAAQVHAAVVKYMAVGGVVGAGIMTLFKTMPIILGSFRSVVDALRSKGSPSSLRTEKDVPLGIVFIGAGVLLLLLAVFPHLPGYFPASLFHACLIVVFGFFFVAVASRFVGVAGYTIEPTSSMMFTTVMATCLIFILLGWTSMYHQMVVVLIATVVCVAANNAGATSQDLKTGFLLGATPYRQQIGLVIGILVSALVVGGTLMLLDHSIPHVPHAIGYIAPGQEAPKFGAPQGTLLAMLIKTVLGGKVPWGLVLLGAGLAILLELSGAIALSIAAGLYLPIGVTAAIFAGSLIRWITTKKQTTSSGYSELSKGMLYATGLVAGGALSGMLLGFLNGFFPGTAKWMDLGHEYWKFIEPWGDYLAIIVFGLLGTTLYRYARKDRSS